MPRYTTIGGYPNADPYFHDEETMSATEQLPEEKMAYDIDRWVEREIEAGKTVPDFWDDLSTSDRLACYLTSIGWEKR